MTTYDHLVKRVNAVDPSKSVKKADYDTKVKKKKKMKKIIVIMIAIVLPLNLIN